MEQSLVEVLRACERFLVEEKSGTRERSIVSAVTESLRRYTQEVGSPKKGTGEPHPPPTKGVEASTANSSNVTAAGGSPSPSVSPAPALSSDPTLLVTNPSQLDGASVTPLVPYLSQVEELNRLSFACRTALISDPNRLSGGRGSKTLVSALELVAVVFHAGALPSELYLPPPSLEFTPNAAGGFFSKLLGGSSAISKVADNAGATSPNPSSGAALPLKAENVRSALVDAVIATADWVYTKEPNDKLWYVFISALLAATVPHCSRLTASSAPGELRVNSLDVHGAQLMRVVQILFGVFARPNLSPIVVDEARNALNTITKAVTKSAEREDRHANGSTADAKSAGPEAAEDLIAFVECCCAIARTSPLASDGTGAPPRSAVPCAEMDADVLVAACRSYASLLASLNAVLYIAVNGGPAFRKTDGIIQCIRHTVVPAAVRTSISSQADVFRLSLNVLLQCCLIFGPHLVHETSTVFRHVYFRVLSSNGSPLSHKSMVIEAFQTYIEEPQHMINLFLNFDCNTHSQSLYEVMISYLGALAKPPAAIGVLTARDDSLDNTLDNSLSMLHLNYSVPETIRRKALAVLLLVAESNIQWIERFETTNPTRPEGIHDDTIANDALDANHLVAGSMDAGAGRIAEDLVATTAAATVFSSTSTAAASNEVFVRAKRYKDAVRRFTMQFNSGKGSLEAALEHLRTSVLGLPPTSEAAKQLTLVDVPALPTEMNSSASDCVGLSMKESDEVERNAAHVIAQLIKENEDNIDKLVLGDFFAKSFRRVHTRLIFEEWIKLHDFSNLSIDEALRIFLGGFKLLGEAQIVDKTMELFAAHYCRQNPSVFSSADTAFILSFSICMLNTDAHSANVKQKMTEEGFIRNNKGIDEGADVDPAILKGIYNRITQCEIVLRPSKNLMLAASPGWVDPGHRNRGDAGSTLESIPLLRHLQPIAVALTDKVLLPIDLVVSRRRREDVRQEELKAALQDVIEGLQQSSGLGQTVQSPAFVMATSIENALPMWEATVDVVYRLLTASLAQFFEEAEQYRGPLASADRPAGDFDVVQASLSDTQSADFFQILLRGLNNTMRVCCSFGNVAHTEMLLEQCLKLTQLSKTIVFASTPTGTVIQVTQVISRPRLELLSNFLNLYVAHGSAFTWRGWQAGYTALSLIDTLANGMEGMWRRQSPRLQRSDPHQTGPSAKANKDLWFGNLRKVPVNISRDAFHARFSILNTIRSLPNATVDLWLDRLFDATYYAPQCQIQMANALVKVCEKELQRGRTFALSKLFDFVYTCASFSTRLQWRELWSNASVIFIKAGCMQVDVANSVLDGLRIIALTYLMREELLNYSFQKEVLKPFGEILMCNQDVTIRRRVVTIFSEIIDLRAEHLASGWNVVFTCLSHASVIPEVVDLAWEVCERIIVNHIHHLKDCFSDLIFGLTTFACTNVDEQVPLRGISYLVCCGHWLQYGLEAPPADVRDAASIARWASRFRGADQEAAASDSLAKHLVRVTLSHDPLTSSSRLGKPTSLLFKTRYHLWMSLFEGMIPIVVVHSSVRVRSHAICSIWTLIQRYAGAFERDVQDSLFHSMLRPVLNTLLTQVPHPNDHGDYDKADYRILVSLALRGMLLACTQDPHLLDLSCETLTALLSNRTWTLAQINNDLVDVCVRICGDYIAAAEVGVGTVVSTDHLVVSTMSDNNLTSPGADLIAMADPQTSVNDSFAVHEANGFHNSNASVPSWLQPPLSSKKESNPFLMGLLHEAQQVGSVDVVRFKRTTAWTEIHETPAAAAPAVVLPPALRTFSIQSLVRKTVLQCLSTGLLQGLRGTAKANADNREACMIISRAMRRGMLGLSYYCVSTLDLTGVVELLEAASLLSANTDTPDTVANTPVECLLVVPYSCVLLEFIFSFPINVDAIANRMIVAAIRKYLFSMESSRAFCVASQEQVQSTFEASLSPGTEIKRYKGRSFVDVFRSGRFPLARRIEYMPTNAPLPLQQRVFHEWRYLNYLLGIRSALSLGPVSYLGGCLATSELFMMIARLPSAMEEAMVSQFLQGCWEEIDLHCGMPEMGTMAFCLRALQSRACTPDQEETEVDAFPSVEVQRI